MAQFGTETPERLAELNTHLATSNYVNGDLPGADDVRVFDSLKTLPDRNTVPEVHFWYLIIAAFAPNIRAQWAAPKQTEQKGQKKGGQQQQQQQQAPAAEKKAADDDVDLFGDDNEEEAAAAKAAAEAKKAAAVAAKPKKVVIAKTVIIFDVKVYEAENVDLLEGIAKKIREEITLDGLVWGKEHKIEEVAYGAKKLKMNMVVEDDKVQTDDVFDRILAWEDDVQSVDVVTMQKV